MFRSILVPSLIACAIAIPLFINEAKKSNTGEGLVNRTAQQVGFGGLTNPMSLPSSQNTLGQGSFTRNNTPSQSVNFQSAPLGNPVFANGYQNPALGTGHNPAATIQSTPFQNPSFQVGGAIQSGVPVHQVGAPVILGGGSFGSQPILPGMTPDYGAAETFVLPGNANGPNLNAQPLEFLPVTNFEEVLRFDINPSWVKQRWKRVSTAPGEPGLHGLRVALVTGTNSWDLHGSLTYYFDASQRVQRITFRGWAGDGKKLTSLLTQKFGFRPQQTHWAGFYIAQPKQVPTGGLLMQHPTVIYTENPVQQLAIVMEINNPNSNFALSKDFHSLIQGSRNSR